MLAQLSLASYQPQNARLMGKNWKIIDSCACKGLILKVYY